MIIALIVIALLLLTVYLIPIKVRLAFSEKLDFSIKILNIKIFELKDKKKTDEKSEKNKQCPDEDKATDILGVIKSYFEVVIEILKILYQHLKKKLVIQKFSFSVSFGFDDAASTGIFSGAVYTITNVFYAYLLNNFKVKKHNVDVVPNFNNRCFDVSFLLQFNINLFWIICLLFKERKAIDKLLKILKKDGVKNG